VSVNKAPSVIAAWHALCKHSKDSHPPLLSRPIRSGASIIYYYYLAVFQLIIDLEQRASDSFMTLCTLIYIHIYIYKSLTNIFYVKQSIVAELTQVASRRSDGAGTLHLKKMYSCE